LSELTIPLQQAGSPRARHSANYRITIGTQAGMRLPENRWHDKLTFKLYPVMA
jgi:hypothetical protein